MIPYIESTPEQYTVEYGLDRDNLNNQLQPVSSGDNTSVLNQQYSATIYGLNFVTTYYFRIRVTNDISFAVSNILTFTTPEGGKCLLFY